MRDYRINRIFEGSSEIMHLFMAREAVDKHLQVAGAMIDPEKRRRPRSSAALPKIAALLRLAGTRPAGCGWGRWPRYSRVRRAGDRTCASSSAARASWRAQIFHGMIVYQAKLQNKQAFLFRAGRRRQRAVRDGGDGRARAGHARAAATPRRRRPSSSPISSAATRRRKVDAASSTTLWSNDDVRKYKVAPRVLDGKHAWLEEGAMGLGALAQAEMKPQAVEPSKPDPVPVPKARPVGTH